MNNKSIFSGLKWTSIQFGFDAVIKFSLKLILAKLLLPSAFGLLGMCMIFIGITQALSELGMGAALIQKKDDEYTEKLFNTAFWTNLIFAIILYTVLSLIIAPLVAKFYNQTELIYIIPVLSLSVLIRPFTLIQTVILTRDLDFKKLSKIYNSANLASGIIAILAAYYGFGVWALVLNYILSIGLPIPFLQLIVKWKPKLEWNKAYFKEIFGFGMYTTGTSLIRTFSGNIDYLIVGKMLGPNLLGAYTLAFMLSDQLRQFISSITNKVMYPVFGKYQDDPNALKSFYLVILKINAILIYPIMGFIIYLGKDLILTFFDEKWVETILPLKIMAFAMILFLLINTFDTLLRGKGKAKLELTIVTTVNLIVLVPSLIVGIHFYGIIGAALAILLNRFILVIVALITLKKEINLKISEPFIAVKSPFIAILLAMAIPELITYFIFINMFVLKAAFYVIVYIVIIYYGERNYIKKLLKSYLKK